MTTGITTGRIGRQGGLWLAVMLFGALMNPLMLTGPIFMLQVYDRVIPSRSGPTLVVIFVLAAFLYAMMALLDSARVRIMVRIAARVRASVERPLAEVRFRALLREPGHPVALGALRDLDSVHRALASPAMLALLDTPWMLVFFGFLLLLHPALGLLALSGGLVLVGLAVWGQWRSRGPTARAQQSTQAADRVARSLDGDAETLAALGMEAITLTQWQARRGAALTAMLQAQDCSGVDGAVARAFRMLMQSAILALGAWLVLQGHLSPGLIIASSILMGRALAPVEQLATQWTELRAAMVAWRRVAHLLANAPEPASPANRNGRAAGPLSVQGLVVAPRVGGAPLLRIKGFEVPPGRALGVIGASGSGKSTLARVLIGAVPAATGAMRLGDDLLPMPPPVGNTLGYLPQRIALLEGSIADNISRFEPGATPAAVEAAARAAGVHDMIVALPKGYGTSVTASGGPLSGGQVQRVGLARALYGAPQLMILDEPNAHLDAEGSAALNTAIRTLKSRGAVVLVMAHRPAAITECDDLLVLDDGAQVAFGPRERVLRDMVRNHTALVSPAAGARR